jgi:phosphonatase-like hydrolase
MTIKLVVFDMAGTTVRDDDAVNGCLREALSRHVTVSRDEINAVMGLPKPRAIQSVLRSHLGDSEWTRPMADAVHADFLARMIHYYQSSRDVGPMPYAVETFHALRQAGVSIVLDTGFSRPIVDVILARLGWQQGGLITATVSSDEVPRGRPHPDLIWRAMELSGVSEAGRVAKVGDTPSDLHEGAAAACGLVIGVTNGTHAREEMVPHPHTHLISSLKELPAIVLGHKGGKAAMAAVPSNAAVS